MSRAAHARRHWPPLARVRARRLQQAPTTPIQGWIEANLIFVAPDEAGRVQTLSVREGDTVKTGDPLFTVDDDLQQADLDQIKASVNNAQQTYRPRLDAAEDRLRHAEGLRRRGRDAARRAGAAQLRADPPDAPQRLQRRSTAPCSRSISVPARWCRPAGRCCRCCRRATSRCASTCRRRRCRAIAYGDDMKVTCDGCAGDLTARVSFIARQSEFTPPVIYSLEERAKLVFLIEALPEKPGRASRRPAGRRDADAAQDGGAAAGRRTPQASR